MDIPGDLVLLTSSSRSTAILLNCEKWEREILGKLERADRVAAFPRCHICSRREVSLCKKARRLRTLARKEGDWLRRAQSLKSGLVG